ncbi:MAG: signal peptidase I [Pseudomonadota bacterium]
MQIWREWRGVALFIVLMLLFRSVIADWNQVPSGSMRPTILIGDRVVVDKLAYDLRVPFSIRRLSRFDDPGRGDIVTFESPQDGRLLIKRVIGLPGDRIAMQDNELIVNGQPADYRRVAGEELTRLELPDAERFEVLEETIADQSWITLRLKQFNRQVKSFEEVLVPAGQYYMLGDNRDRSGDSRYIGLVDRAAILGRAHTVAFSLDYDNYFIPRTTRYGRSLAAAERSQQMPAPPGS